MSRLFLFFSKLPLSENNFRIAPAAFGTISQQDVNRPASFGAEFSIGARDRVSAIRSPTPIRQSLVT